MDTRTIEEPPTELLETAHRALSALRGTVQAKPDQSAIETDARSLRGVARVIEGLCGEVGKCGGEDCMGREIDGMRLWVAHDQYRRLQEEFARLEERARSFELALAEIARIDADTMPEVTLFLDWQAVARRFQQMAGEALAA